MAETARPDPYIEVSGLNSYGSRGTQISVEGSAIYSGLYTKRLLLEGVKATHKTQMLDQENRYGRLWYPVGDELARALYVADPTPSGATWEPYMLRVVQAYMSPSGSVDPTYRQEFAERIFQRAASWIKGIQFDELPWHTDDTLKDYLANLRATRQVPVILQCHREAMEALGPQEAIRKLGEYATAGAIDYVLFDASGGKGRTLDITIIRPYLAEAFASTALASTGIGVAGGLNGPAVLDRMPELVADYPDTSWGAEARLRNGGITESSYLDRTLAQEYLWASAIVLRQT